jgi:hypothetical protein
MIVASAAVANLLQECAADRLDYIALNLVLRTVRVMTCQQS